MLKLDVRFVVGGKSYKLKEEVVSKFKKTFLSFTVAGVAIFGTAYVYADKQIDASEVTYEEVFIGEDGLATSAAGAISALNKTADYRDLIEFFEEKNDVDSAGSIDAGTYLVPVISGE